VTFPVTVIDHEGIRRACCSVPRFASRAALRRWLARVLDLGDPAGWHMAVRRQPGFLGPQTGLLCAGDRLYLIRRPTNARQTAADRHSPRHRRAGRPQAEAPWMWTLRT
jgi:hypothetical protein